MQINIGKREFKSITQAELYELLIINRTLNNEGHIIDKKLLRPWNDPEINKIEWCDNTFYFYGTQTRIKDNHKITFEGHIDFDSFTVVIQNSTRNETYIDSLKFASYNWIIERGFNIPLSTF